MVKKLVTYLTHIALYYYTQKLQFVIWFLGTNLCKSEVFFIVHHVINMSCNNGQFSILLHLCSKLVNFSLVS